jgi:hypothetical protein
MSTLALELNVANLHDCNYVRDRAGKGITQTPIVVCRIVRLSGALDLYARTE